MSRANTSCNLNDMFLNPITDPQGTAVCFKHDKVVELLEDAIAVTKAAKFDGKRMEAGLRRKSKKIEELQHKLDVQKQLVRLLRKEVAQLEKSKKKLERRVLRDSRHS